MNCEKCKCYYCMRATNHKTCRYFKHKACLKRGDAELDDCKHFKPTKSFIFRKLDKAAENIRNFFTAGKIRYYLIKGYLWR